MPALEGSILHRATTAGCPYEICDGEHPSASGRQNRSPNPKTPARSAAARPGGPQHRVQLGDCAPRISRGGQVRRADHDRSDRPNHHSMPRPFSQGRLHHGKRPIGPGTDIAGHGGGPWTAAGGGVRHGIRGERRASRAGLFVGAIGPQGIQAGPDRRNRENVLDPVSGRARPRPSPR